MRLKKGKFGFFGIFTSLALMVAAPPARAETVELRDAFRLELGADFFSALSAEVYRKNLQTPERNPLDDMEDDNDGVKIKARGISYIVPIRSFHFRPETGSMAIRVSIGDVNLHVDELEINYRFIHSKCRNTNVDIAPGSQVQAGVALSLSAGSGPGADPIQIGTQSVQFEIPESQYQVGAPEKCSGLLGGPIRSAIKKQLLKLRPKLEEKVRAKLASLAPTLQQKLNDKIGKRKDDSGQTKPWPNEKFYLATLGATPGGLFMEFGTRLDIPQPMPLVPPRMTEPSGFAYVGFNYQLVNLKLASRFPRQAEYREIKADDVQELQSALSQETLSEYLPDLRNLALDSPQLRAFVRTDSSPSIEPIDGGLIVRMPRINVKLQVLEYGQWRDYHVLWFDVAPKLAFVQSPDKLEIKIVDFHDVRVGGEWAPGYPRSRADVAYPLLAGTVGDLLELLTREHNSFPLDLPSFEFEGLKLQGTIQLKGPFIGVGVSAK